MKTKLNLIILGVIALVLIISGSLLLVHQSRYYSGESRAEVADLIWARLPEDLVEFSKTQVDRNTVYRNATYLGDRKWHFKASGYAPLEVATIFGGTNIESFNMSIIAIYYERTGVVDIQSVIKVK